MSGCRRGFEPIPTPKADLAIQEVAADKGGSSSATCVNNGYDPQLASGGNNDGCNGNNVQVVPDERLPLVWQRSGARKLEGGEFRSAHDGPGGNAESIGEGEGADAGGGEIRGRGSRRAFLTECLLPMKLLKKKRVRTAMLVYVLVSVRWACSGPLAMTTLQASHVWRGCIARSRWCSPNVPLLNTFWRGMLAARNTLDLCVYVSHLTKRFAWNWVLCDGAKMHGFAVHLGLPSSRVVIEPQLIPFGLQ